MSKRDKLIQLGAEIQSTREQLVALKDRLRAAEAEFDRVMASDESELASSPQQVGAGRKSGHLVERIIALMDASPNKEFTPDDVVAALGGDENVNSVRSTLAREGQKETAIVKVKYGVYQSVKGRTRHANMNGANGALFSQPQGGELPQA